MKYLIYATLIIATACSSVKKQRIGDIYFTDVVTKDTLYSVEWTDLSQKIEVLDIAKLPNHHVGILKVSSPSASLAMVVPFNRGTKNIYQLNIPKSFAEGQPLKNANVISYSGNQMLNNYQQMLDNVMKAQSDSSLAVNTFIHDLYRFYKNYPQSGMVGYHLYEMSANMDEANLARYLDPKSKVEWDELIKLDSDVFSSELERLRNTRKVGSCKSHPSTKLVFQSSNSTIHPDVLEGNVKVVVFWATWCGPCKPQMKQLAALNESKYQNSPVVFFAISSEQDEKQLYRWVDTKWKDHGADYLGFFYDKEHCMATNYEITQLPTIMVFDKNDNLIKKYCDLPEVERIVDSLLLVK